MVIAGVSDQVPVTLGPRTLGAEELDVIVRTSRSPAEYPARPISHVEQRIARRAAELIPDGATLQAGVGRLPEAILRELAGHRDLGVHTGLINDAMAELMAAGVITNARKAIDPGRAVGGVLLGTRRLFDFADRNPAIELRDTRYTHHPEVLAGQRRFTAINAAVEVDLTGQVNAEVAGGAYVGAIGGALDFLRGAARAPEGLPIIALPAARIVHTLSGPVTIGRADAGIIVTEHGAADLRGRTLAERRHLLQAIAEPEVDQT